MFPFVPIIVAIVLSVLQFTGSDFPCGIFQYSICQLCFLIYVICVFLHIVVSNTYCVVFFVLFVFVLCLVYGDVQHILCCVFYVVCLRLVYGGVQHVLCCVFCFVLCDQCFASFSGLSIRDSPLGFSNVYLMGYLN